MTWLKSWHPEGGARQSDNGNDTILDDSTGADASLLIFGAGVNPADIKLRKGSLLLDLGNGDAIHIADFDANDPLANPTFESFQFADGVTLTWNELLAKGFDLDGTGNDILIGSAAQDLLTGGEGNDLLLGGAGDDLLLGDTTLTTASQDWSVTRTVNDNLYTYTIASAETADSASIGGDDALYGGAGNDVLFGDAGNDQLWRLWDTRKSRRWQHGERSGRRRVGAGGTVGDCLGRMAA